MDDVPLWVLIIILFVLVVFSGFFSAAETAYTSINETRLKTMAKTKKSARLALKLSDKFERVLSTLLIGNNIVNIAAASISTVVFVHYFNDLGVTLSTIVTTVVILVFAEITPKSISKINPEKVAMFTSFGVYCFYYLFLPLNYIFDGFLWCISKLFRLDKNTPSITEEEFKLIVSDIKDEGVINQNEHDLIQKSIRYDDTVVKSIMQPKDLIVFIKKGENKENIRKLFEDNNYSRVPLFDETSTKCLGLIFQRDFYEMLLNNKDDIDSIVKKVIFTKPTTKISDLFKRFQKVHQHLAVVRDDDLNILGIVTMEDIIEELVGEIEDEYDDE